MPTINQNATSSISLNAGQWIDVKGTGVAVPQIGPTKGQPQTITNFGKVGPFDFAQTVSLTATGGALTYNIIEDWPDARAPVDATGSPTGQLKTPDGLVIDGFVDRPAGTTLVLDAPSTYAPLTISGAATIAITGSTAGASAS